MKSSLYPTLEEALQRKEQKERILFQFRRSWYSILGYFITALLALLFTVLLIYLFGHLRIPTTVPVLRSLSVYFLLIVPIGIVLEGLRQYHDDLYIFEGERVIHKGGRLSINYAVPTIKYADLRSIGVHQSIFGRIFDYGDVILETAALDDSELSLGGVRHPFELAEFVDSLRTFSLNRSMD